MPSKSNKETGSTIDSHAFKKRVLNISLSLIFASIATGCNQGTANTSAKAPKNPIAAYEATFQDSPPALVVMFEHTTQSLVKIKSGKADDVLFKNYFAFNSPTYGLVACGQFGIKKGRRSYVEYKGYLATEKDTALYIEGDFDGYYKLYEEICVDEYNKAKLRQVTSKLEEIKPIAPT